jgi:hypothetical protein
MFSLVVDDFGVKYEGKDNADHLIHALRQLYTISISWEGSLYLGLSLHWDYQQHTQAKATKKTLTTSILLLNYAALHPDATIGYHASNMILHTHSNASYLLEPESRSHAGGHYFLSDLSTTPTEPPTNLLPTMDLSSPSPASCTMSWVLQPKLKWVQPISMGRRPSPSGPPWKN